MIGKHSRGWDVAGLLRYLMGPGRANEHVQQRVVAAWNGDPAAVQPVVKDPARLSSVKACGFDVRDLATRLRAPARCGEVSLTRPAPDEQGRVPAGPVWHCSLRNHADDRVLTDQEWADVAADVMHRTGIAPRDDPGGCRWVAIRHADDHVHLAAVLVRQDSGHRFNPRRDWPATMAACHVAEARYGLVPTAAADRTALAKPTRAETEKAVRRLGTMWFENSVETPRTWLARMVRQAAVESADLDSFFARLRQRQVLVELRRHGAGEGLVFGVLGDVTKTGSQVWFAGSTLAPDLSLPSLRARWAATPGQVPSVEPGAAPGTRQEQDAAELAALEVIDQAAETVHQATATLRAAGPDARPDPRTAEKIAGIIHATGDLTCVLPGLTWWYCPVHRYSPNYVDRPVEEIPEWVFQRATRQPGVGQPRRWDSIATELRSTARSLAYIHSRGAVLMLALIELIAEVMAWHEQTRHLAQAHAARVAGDQLYQAQIRPAGYPDHPGSPSRPREDSRRPGHRHSTVMAQRAQTGRAQKLATLRRQITEKAMSRRPAAHYSDAELARLIRQSEQTTTSTRTRAEQLCTQLSQLGSQVTAGQGPQVRQLHAQLTELRECVRLHQEADEQRRYAHACTEQAQQLSLRGLRLRRQASENRLRWPGQRARLAEEATQLIAQSDKFLGAASGHRHRADQLSRAAAEHGPAQSRHAYNGLGELETGWARWTTRAQHQDAEQLTQLRADIEKADTDTVHAAAITSRLTAEYARRQSQTPQRRDAENEVRQTRRAAAAAPRKQPAQKTKTYDRPVTPVARPPGIGHSPGRRL